MSHKQTIRFGAGEPNSPRSYVWNVVASTRKEDIYLGQRRAMGTTKMSLHKNVWRYANTSQSGAISPATGTRLHQEWAPLEGYGTGWSKGPFVIVPHVSTPIASFTADQKERTKAVQWVPGPGEGTYLSFGMMLASPGVDTLPPIDPPLRTLGHIVSARGNVWIVVGEEPMHDELRDYAESLASGLRVHVEPGSKAEVHTALVPIIGDWPGFIEILLGPDNVTEEPPGGDAHNRPDAVGSAQAGAGAAWPPSQEIRFRR